MTYFILISNCLSMGMGAYLVYDGQFILGVVCFLISFIGFRQLCIEIDRRNRKKKKKVKRPLEKPKIKIEKPMSIEAQIRLNKFSIN